MVVIRNNNPTFRALLAFWKKHSTIEMHHINWIKENIEIIKPLSKGDIIYLQGQKQKYVYFVSHGAIARIIYDSDYKIHILSIALPEMALMSTVHLFSSTPSVGNIIALHANTRIIKIPYKALKHVQQDIPEVNTLVSILNNKKKKQLAQLRILSSISSTIDRYLYFAENMKNLKASLTHKEAAQLLGISINSIYRALIKWRNR